MMTRLWQFTKQVWAHRNQAVHGQMVDEQADIILHWLRDKVQEYYTSNQADNTFVLPCHQHLFTHRMLDQRLWLTYDHLNSWIRSVEEARAALAYQMERERGMMAWQFLHLMHKHVSLMQAPAALLMIAISLRTHPKLRLLSHLIHPQQWQQQYPCQKIPLPTHLCLLQPRFHSWRYHLFYNLRIRHYMFLTKLSESSRPQ